MKVRIIRGDVENEYPGVIVNNLCTDTVAGIPLGTAFLYDEGFDKLRYSIDITPTADTLILKGSDILEVIDASIGEVFRGRIISTSISGVFSEALDLVQNIVVERSIDG